MMQSYISLSFVKAARGGSHHWSREEKIPARRWAVLPSRRRWGKASHQPHSPVL